LQLLQRNMKVRHADDVRHHYLARVTFVRQW